MLGTLALLLVATQPIPGAAYDPGDTVVLVTRDIHVPAHRAPHDPGVPFRFVSGSIAEILAVDGDGGWIQLRGDRVGDGQAVGWVVQRYVAGLHDGDEGDGALPPELAWCPPKGSPAPHPYGRLRIATWNLGNLHAEDGKTTYLAPDPSVRRFAVDYRRIRCYVRSFDPDILAVQEVDGADALRRVVDTDVYDVHVSRRPRLPGMGGRQNTGFAYKKGLAVTPRADLEELDVTGSVRRGSRIDLTHNGHTFKLLSVHLKSGCFSNESTSTACRTLAAQVPILEDWIDAAARGPDPFIVLGDFNRRLNLSGDTVWAELDDGQPADADLTSLTAHMPIDCRDNRHRTFIDHVVVDQRALAFVDRASFRHVTYRHADRDVWDLISDHCPVMVELRIP